MKPHHLLLILLLASCNGNHPERYNVDVKELKTLPDNFYAYYRGAVFVDKTTGVMIWYTIDEDGNIVKISKVQDTKDPKANTTAQAIKKYSLDTVKEKAVAVHFTQLSHKYHFGHIRVDRKNKIAYSTNPDIIEEYIYPLNDSVTRHYQKDDSFTTLENGWFKYND